MKRKLMLGLLSAVGGLTIIGSGFSAWYFGDNDAASKNYSIHAQVTCIADTLGAITLDTDIAGVALQLDQGGFANKADTDKGISFVKGLATFNEPLKATYKIEYGASKLAKDAGLKASFDCLVTLKKEFAEYIEFKNSFYGETFTTGLDKAGNTTINLSKPITFTEAQIIETYEFNIATETNLTNNAFKYIDGQKPQDKTAHGNFHTLLNGVHENALTFTYSLNVTHA